MRIRIITMVFIIIAVTGCGKIDTDTETVSKITEKKADVVVENEIKEDVDAVFQEDTGTNADEVIEEKAEVPVLKEPVQPSKIGTTEEKQEMQKKQEEAATHAVSVAEAVVSEVVSVQPEHTHTWEEFVKDIPHNYIWYERVGDWRTLCGRCKLDMTDLSSDNLVWHVTVECNSRYYTTFVDTGEPIRHEETKIEPSIFVRCTECGYETLKDALNEE